MRRTERTGAALNHNDHVIDGRVRAEFMEMPGLKLTLPQAARLFDLDAVRCEQVLDTLVQRGVLAAIGGAFMRADAGRRQA